MASSITATMHDLLQDIYLNTVSIEVNVSPMTTIINASATVGLAAQALPTHENADVTIRNIKQGTTIYIGDNSSQLTPLEYGASYKTGFISDLSNLYIRCSDANGEVTILGGKL